jgi:hypothetical protein
MFAWFLSSITLGDSELMWKLNFLAWQKLTNIVAGSRLFSVLCLKINLIMYLTADIPTLVSKVTARGVSKAPSRLSSTRYVK